MYVCVFLLDREYKEDKIEWWKNVWGFNMTPIRAQAMIEPLVDTVESRAVLTDYCKILSVDIYTVKKEDLDFSSNFKLTFQRQDFCHALVAYFDVEFTKCHVKVVISTGPADRYTHWKQTVFYLDEELVATRGDIITGKIQVHRNAKNPRDIDIRFDSTFNGRKMGTVTQGREYRLR